MTQDGAMTVRNLPTRTPQGGLTVETFDSVCFDSDHFDATVQGLCFAANQYTRRLASAGFTKISFLPPVVAGTHKDQAAVAISVTCDTAKYITANRQRGAWHPEWPEIAGFTVVRPDYQLGFARLASTLANEYIPDLVAAGATEISALPMTITTISNARLHAGAEAERFAATAWIVYTSDGFQVPRRPETTISTIA